MKRLLSKLRALYSLSRYGYLVEKNWFQSYISKESLIAGKEVPWFSYPCIAFLEQRQISGLKILEFGSGNSTVWFTKRNNSIHSIETSKKWIEKLKEREIIDMQMVYQVSEENYFFPIHQKNLKNFDLIIIDGKRRNDCMKRAPKLLSDNGVIILDNSDRKKYEPGMDFLLDKGFRKIDFEGMTPGVTIKTTTTLFYKNPNCLNI